MITRSGQSVRKVHYSILHQSVCNATYNSTRSKREIIYYSQRKMQKRSRKCRKVDRNAKSVIILNVKCKKSSKNHRNHEIINYSQRKMQKSRMTRKKIESGTFGALGWVGWVGLGWAGLRFFGHKP